MDELERRARQRVADVPELAEYDDAIFADWPNWQEHLQWLIDAPVDHILDWAELAWAFINEDWGDDNDVS